MNQQEYITFAAKVSHVGKAKQAQIYIPKTIDVLLVSNKLYKITLTEIEEDNVGLR